MASCPHCGAGAHPAGRCPALDEVRRALTFPAQFDQRARGRVLRVRTRLRHPWEVALCVGLIAASLGALHAASDLAGLLATFGFGLGAAIYLALAGDAEAAYVEPGQIVRIGGQSVADHGLRIARARLLALEIRPMPRGYEIVARCSDGASERLLSGIRARRVAERVAAEMERVVRTEPFVGERAMPLPSGTAEQLAMKWGWPRTVKVSADDDALVVEVGRARLRISSDEVTRVELLEAIAAPDGEPSYQLELSMRRGEKLRPVPAQRDPAKMIQLASSLRALWRLPSESGQASGGEPGEQGGLLP